MSLNISIVASFADHRVAGSALRNLQRAGFDMKKLAVVGRDAQGLPVDMEGARLVGKLDDLDSIQFNCIPPERVPDYRNAVRDDKVLLVAHGSVDEIARAKDVIDETRPEGWDGSVGTALYYGCVD
jgi:hypothetical protein